MCPKLGFTSCANWLNQQLAKQHNQSTPPSPQLPIPPTHPAATEIIPSHILTKPPSAELKPGQVDQDSLPSYEILDDILERLVQHHESVADMLAAGHEFHVVERVIRLVSRAEFKRRQAPRF
jgi:NAD+ synthase (glutamine-hydrolysing)